MITLEGIPEPLNRGRDEKPDVLIGGDASQPAAPGRANSLKWKLQALRKKKRRGGGSGGFAGIQVERRKSDHQQCLWLNSLPAPASLSQTCCFSAWQHAGG